MITIELLCTGKNARLESKDILTDVTFQSINSPTSTHSTGAVIGVPNLNNLPNNNKVSYNIISGAISVSIADIKEADKYQVGQIYQLSLTSLKSSK